MKIPNFPRTKRRKKNWFDDLPVEIAWRAEQWFSHFVARRNQQHRRIRDWELPILVGQARRFLACAFCYRLRWFLMERGRKIGHSASREKLAYQAEGIRDASKPPSPPLCRALLPLLARRKRGQ